MLVISIEFIWATDAACFNLTGDWTFGSFLISFPGSLLRLLIYETDMALLMACLPPPTLLLVSLITLACKDALSTYVAAASLLSSILASFPFFSGEALSSLGESTSTDVSLIIL